MLCLMYKASLFRCLKPRKSFMSVLAWADFFQTEKQNDLNFPKFIIIHRREKVTVCSMSIIFVYFRIL